MSLDFLEILGRRKKNKISQGGVWADLTPPFVTVDVHCILSEQHTERLTDCQLSQQPLNDEHKPLVNAEHFNLMALYQPCCDNVGRLAQAAAEQLNRENYN